MGLGFLGDDGNVVGKWISEHLYLQGFSLLALLAFGARSFFVVGVLHTGGC